MRPTSEIIIKIPVFVDVVQPLVGKAREHARGMCTTQWRVHRIFAHSQKGISGRMRHMIRHEHRAPSTGRPGRVNRPLRQTNLAANRPPASKAAGPPYPRSRGPLAPLAPVRHHDNLRHIHSERRRRASCEVGFVSVMRLCRCTCSSAAHSLCTVPHDAVVGPNFLERPRSGVVLDVYGRGQLRLR